MLEGVKQNADHYKDLQTGNENLRQELLMLVTTEASKRQDSIAVVTTDLNHQRADLQTLTATTEVLLSSLFWTHPPFSSTCVLLIALLCLLDHDLRSKRADA
jgi:hypothetical protein